MHILAFTIHHKKKLNADKYGEGVVQVIRQFLSDRQFRTLIKVEHHVETSVT